MSSVLKSDTGGKEGRFTLATFSEGKLLAIPALGLGWACASTTPGFQAEEQPTKHYVMGTEVEVAVWGARHRKIQKGPRWPLPCPLATAPAPQRSELVSG